jgi:hypothetical protein
MSGELANLTKRIVTLERTVKVLKLFIGSATVVGGTMGWMGWKHARHLKEGHHRHWRSFVLRNNLNDPAINNL